MTTLDTRRQLMERFARDGAESLSDREVLCALLTYCRGTGELTALADGLLARYGSLAGFTEAEYEELASLRGLDRNAALFLWTVCACAKRATDQRRYELTVSSPDIAARLVHRRLALRDDEAHFAIYLDDSLKFLDMRPATWIGIGSGALSEFDVMARASELNCSNVIVARNRVPNGPTPEEERRRDLNFLGALRNMNVTLLDILIFDGEDYVSMDRMGLFDWEVEKIRKLYREGSDGIA